MGPEALLIALFLPARSMADGVIFPFQAHAIAAPAHARRPAEGSRISHGGEPWPGSLRA